MNQQNTFKHWFFSSFQTFISAFFIAILPAISTTTSENWTKAFLIALLATGVRAGIKAIGIIVSPSTP